MFRCGKCKKGRQRKRFWKRGGGYKETYNVQYNETEKTNVHLEMTNFCIYERVVRKEHWVKAKVTYKVYKIDSKLGDSGRIL